MFWWQLCKSAKQTLDKERETPSSQSSVSASASMHPKLWALQSTALNNEQSKVSKSCRALQITALKVFQSKINLKQSLPKHYKQSTPGVAHNIQAGLWLKIPNHQHFNIQYCERCMKRLLFMLYVMFLPVWLSVSELSSQYRYHKFGCDKKACVGILYWRTCCQNRCLNRNYIMCCACPLVVFSLVSLKYESENELSYSLQCGVTKKSK